MMLTLYMRINQLIKKNKSIKVIIIYNKASHSGISVGVLFIIARIHVNARFRVDKKVRPESCSAFATRLSDWLLVVVVAGLGGSGGGHTGNG